MKKIFLALAAVAALASCVKENTLVPEQTDDNLVTIKAVSADTKTLLNGTDVVWEDTDNIKVVLDLATDELQDFAASAVDGATATFKGQFATDVASASQAYAVYPSSAVKLNGTSASIYHTIQAEQYGEIKSGANLSYASLNVEKLAAGNATATFNNVYSLIKVTVPEGLKEVTIASESPLAGTAPFRMEAGTLKVNTSAWSSLDQEKTVRLLPSEGEHLEAKTHDVLIFPGTHALTITLSDGTATYEKTVAAKEYAAATYYNLNLTTVLSAPVTEYLASPFGGGTIEIPFVTTVDAPSYDVQIENGDDWLSYVDVKALTEGTVTLAVATGENTTADRTATVTVTETTSKKSMVVSVTQKYVETELLGDYMESYTQSSQPKFGTMTIDRSDDYTQGVYKITICGENYYADYEADDEDDDECGTLIYHYGKGYPLKVAPDFSQFTAENLGLSGGSNASGYSALKSLGEPELNAEELALIGDYNETFWYSENGYDASSKKKMTTSLKGMNIQKSEDLAYGRFKVKCLTYGGYWYTAYATYSDGKLTVNVGKTTHQYFNTLGIDSLEPIVFTVEDGTLTFDSWSCKYMYQSRTVEDYVATKVVDDPGAGDDPIAGTWNVTCSMGNYAGSDYQEMSGEMVISGSNGTYVIESIAGTEFNLTVSMTDNTLSGTNGGGTLTLIYDSTAETLTQKGEYVSWVPSDYSVKELVATKPVAAVDITGSYSGSGASPSCYSGKFTDTFTISPNNDSKGQYKITGLFDVYGAYGGGTYYANFADNTLTILAANSLNDSSVGGGLPDDIMMTYADGTFTLNQTIRIVEADYDSVWADVSITSYTATKQ